MPPLDRPDDGGDGPSRRIVLTPASRIRLRPTRWVWDTTPPGATAPALQGRFPTGSLVLGAGRAGIGKSQFAAWLTAQVTRGTLPGCFHGTPRGVIYAAAEDSWAMTVGPRLVAAGTDLDRAYRVDVHADADPHACLTLPVDTRRLEDAILEHDVGMVVLDPLLSLIDGGVNDYRAREVRGALEPLVAMADRTECLLFGLAHFVKAAGVDPLTLVAGSGAFGQLIRAGVGFARDEHADDEGTFVLSQIKNNLGREDLPSLQYVIQPAVVDTLDGPSYVSRFHFTGEEAERSVRDLLRGDDHADTVTERDEAVEWLRGHLAAGDVPATDVFKAGERDGFSRDVLKRAKKRLDVKSGKTGMDGIWVWRLTGEGSAKGAKGAPHTHVPPSLPSAPPSRTGRRCDTCGEPLIVVEAGQTTHPNCTPRKSA